MLLVITTLLLATAAPIEIYLKLPLPRTIYLLVMFICFVETICISRVTKKNKFRQMSLLLSLALMIHLVPWTHRKVFLVAFRQIEPGMTESQVKEVLAGFILLQNPDPNTLTYRPSLASEFDSDFGFIHLEKGQVKSTSWSPD